MLIQEAKNKLHEVLAVYTTNFSQCLTIEELKLPSQNMIQSVVNIFMPKYMIKYLPVVKADPQDDEESKEDLSSDKKVAIQLQKLDAVIQTRALEIQASVQDITADRVGILAYVNKYGGEGQKNFAQPIDFLNKKIQELEQEDVQNRNTKKSLTDEILDRIQKLTAQICKQNPAQLQKIDSIKPVIKQFTYRSSGQYMPFKGLQDQEVPKKDDLSYEIFLSAINCNNGYSSFNFIFNNGVKSENCVEDTPKQRRIDGLAKRIILWYDTNASIKGIKIYDKDGAVLFAKGFKDYEKDFKSYEIILEEGERIVGFKSRKLEQARHGEFEFIIGRLF